MTLPLINAAHSTNDCLGLLDISGMHTKPNMPTNARLDDENDKTGIGFTKLTFNLCLLNFI